jgi:hypothetical protein
LITDQFEINNQESYLQDPGHMTTEDIHDDGAQRLYGTEEGFEEGVS